MLSVIETGVWLNVFLGLCILVFVGLNIHLTLNVLRPRVKPTDELTGLDGIKVNPPVVTGNTGLFHRFSNPTLREDLRKGY